MFFPTLPFFKFPLTVFLWQLIAIETLGGYLCDDVLTFITSFYLPLPRCTQKYFYP